jgi:hypothetical protein
MNKLKGSILFFTIILLQLGVTRNTFYVKDNVTYVDQFLFCGVCINENLVKINYEQKSSLFNSTYFYDHGFYNQKKRLFFTWRPIRVINNKSEYSDLKQLITNYNYLLNFEMKEEAKLLKEKLKISLGDENALHILYMETEKMIEREILNQDDKDKDSFLRNKEN